MAKNSRPILSVLIEEDKRTKFADLARRHSLSMGWLVNQAIDRYIESDSIDIYRDSIERIPAGTPMGVSIEQLLPPSIDIADIEKLISDSIDKRGLIDEETAISVGLSAADVDKIVETSIARLGLINEEQATGIIDRKLKPVEELRSELSEVSEFAHNLQGEIVKVKKALSVGVASPTENRETPDTIAPVQVMLDLPSAKTQPEGEPNWVKKDERRWYRQLADNGELLAKVSEATARHPKDNTALAESLVGIGLHKQDGRALDSSSISRIRTVASRLNTPS